MYIAYEVNTRYPSPDEQPPSDGVALVLEGIPFFKLWLAAPLDVELACLKGVCTHIGLVPPSIFHGGLPFFHFKSTSGKTLFVRAPLGATQEQVKAWASADANAFTFLLMEREPAMVRHIRTIGVPQDFRDRVAEAWLSINHPIDMQKCHQLLAKMNDQTLWNNAQRWTYQPGTDRFTHASRL
jgi:hypothetical protein